MKILVTGGTGFVGGHLISELLAEGGNQVYVLVRDSDKLATCAFPGRRHRHAGRPVFVRALPG